MLLDVLNNFDKSLKELKDKVDFTLDFTKSKNLLKLRFPLTSFFQAVCLNYYMPYGIEHYVNKTVKHLDEFSKIENEDDFKKYLQKMNKD